MGIAERWGRGKRVIGTGVEARVLRWVTGVRRAGGVVRMARFGVWTGRRQRRCVGLHFKLK